MTEIEEKAAALTPEQRSGLKRIRNLRLITMIVLVLITACLCFSISVNCWLRAGNLELKAEHDGYDYSDDEKEERLAEIDDMLHRAGMLKTAAAIIFFASVPIMMAEVYIVYLCFKKKYPYYSPEVLRYILGQEQRDKDKS